MNLKKLAFRSVATAINGLSFISPDQAGALAFRLFATPPRPHIRPKEQAFLDTARRSDHSIEGYEVPVYEWGPAAGPVVFCAYGWGYNAGRWRHYVPRLVEAGNRVVAFDFPGHGHCRGKRFLTYPLAAEIEMELIRRLEGVDLVLAHSFGGSCLVESLTMLPEKLRPRRMCLLAIVSEVKWMFAGFARYMGLRDVVHRKMPSRLEAETGRTLDEFDVATVASQLSDLPTLLVHDPEDTVTTYRNALRNHSHWLNSWLYSPRGAGHHLGTAEVTGAVLDWLIEGNLPASAVQNTGALPPLSTNLADEDVRANGLTDFYD